MGYFAADVFVAIRSTDWDSFAVHALDLALKDKVCRATDQAQRQSVTSCHRLIFFTYPE